MAQTVKEPYSISERAKLAFDGIQLILKMKIEIYGEFPYHTVVGCQDKNYVVIIISLT